MTWQVVPFCLAELDVLRHNRLVYSSGIGYINYQGHHVSGRVPRCRATRKTWVVKDENKNQGQGIRSSPWHVHLTNGEGTRCFEPFLILHSTLEIYSR
jgi:hypothetical protein